MGGSNQAKISTAVVEVYREDEGRWSYAPPMSSPRSRFAAVTFADGKIYALGGWGGSAHLNTVERFDPRNTRWEFVPHMNLLHAISGFGYCKT